MGWVIRTLFIWLLVVAVPAQGAAAVTMVHCGPNHAGDALAAPAPAGQAGAHTHHGGEADHAHQHPGSGAQADDDGFAPLKAPHADKHKCSACASCCSAAALPSSVLSVPASVIPPTVFATVVASVDRFAADGLDRPPRMVLA